MTTIGSDSRAAFVLSALFVIVLAAYYFTLLPHGSIQLYDETLTYDRSQAFVARGDYFTVYATNEPSFKKPPLQYWMSAALIASSVDVNTALRFPSWLFSILTLASAGFLAHQLQPRRPFVAPAAIALLAGSQVFWTLGISAMLDSGAALFSTLTIAGCLAAFRQPRWWYLVALAVGLGALHKAPTSLALAVFMILVAIATARFSGTDLRATFSSRHFVIAAALTAAMLLFWPVLQVIQYGVASLEEAYLSEIFKRRLSAVPARDNMPDRPLHALVFDSEFLLRLPGLLALAALPFVLRRRELLSLPLMVLVYVAIAAIVGANFRERYFLIFLPMVTAVLAVITVELLASRPWAAIVAIAGLSFTSFGPFKTSEALGHMSRSPLATRPFLEEVGATLREEETLVSCTGQGMPYPSVVSIFASNGRPFLRIRSFEDLARMERNGKARPPYRGICRESEVDDIRRRFGFDAILEQNTRLVHWRSQKPSEGQ